MRNAAGITLFTFALILAIASVGAHIFYPLPADAVESCSGYAICE